MSHVRPFLDVTNEAAHGARAAGGRADTSKQSGIRSIVWKRSCTSSSATARPTPGACWRRGPRSPRRRRLAISGCGRRRRSGRRRCTRRSPPTPSARAAPRTRARARRARARCARRRARGRRRSRRARRATRGRVVGLVGRDAAAPAAGAAVRSEVHAARVDGQRRRRRRGRRRRVALGAAAHSIAKMHRLRAPHDSVAAAPARTRARARAGAAARAARRPTPSRRRRPRTRPRSSRPRRAELARRAGGVARDDAAEPRRAAAAGRGGRASARSAATSAVTYGCRRARRPWPSGCTRAPTGRTSPRCACRARRARPRRRRGLRSAATGSRAASASG